MKMLYSVIVKCFYGVNPSNIIKRKIFVIILYYFYNNRTIAKSNICIGSLKCL